jgi:flavodoxin I
MKVIVIYGSTTGLTEKLSGIVETSLRTFDWDICRKNVREVRAAELLDYDLIVMGCSTWGNGELQEDFIPFEEELRKISLRGKRVSLFGAGSRHYPHFCAAVDILERSLKNSEADILMTSLKIDEGEEVPSKKIADWVEGLSRCVPRSSLKTNTP